MKGLTFSRASDAQKKINPGHQCKLSLGDPLQRCDAKRQPNNTATVNYSIQSCHTNVTNGNRRNQAAHSGALRKIKHVKPVDYTACRVYPPQKRPVTLTIQIHAFIEVPLLLILIAHSKGTMHCCVPGYTFSSPMFEKKKKKKTRTK